MSENEIRERTRIYLTAYDEAMKIVHNPEFAMQTAMSVLMTVNTTRKEQNPLDVFAQMITKMTEKEESVEKKNGRVTKQGDYGNDKVLEES